MELLFEESKSIVGDKYEIGCVMLDIECENILK